MLDVVANAPALLGRLIEIDSRSGVSNLPVTTLLEEVLSGWTLERIDYVDAKGVQKRNLIAFDPQSSSRLAFTGHTDTVPDVGWTSNAFQARREAGRIVGLGASDMKGPVAAFVAAACSVDRASRPVLVFTADEETTKQGVREVTARSRILKDRIPECFVVCEPTRLQPVRGHRADIQFIATSRGVQAHSSTGQGRNANLQMIPFLADMRALHLSLRSDPARLDQQYDPPFCDLNFVIDNHGAVANMTVPLATCHIKFRYSKSIDPRQIEDEVRRSAAKNDLELIVRREAPPPELAKDDPLVRRLEAIAGAPAIVLGLGTEASEFSLVAPTVIIGPGDLGVAHQPDEWIDIEELEAGVRLYSTLIESSW